MTITRRDWGTSHRYKIDGEAVPGVTTVLNAMAKPALIDWAANTTADYAVDHWDELADMAPSKRLSTLRGARWAENKRATTQGTQVHALGDQLARGQEVVVPDELAGHVEAYVRFLDEWQPHVLWTEGVVANRKARYCGTFDLLADVAGAGRWLFDIKTGRGIYGEAGLQLAAYAGAEVLVEDEREQPMPHVDQIAAVHVRPDGYSVHTFPPIDYLLNVFLHLAAIHRDTADIKEWVSGPVAAPVAALS